MAQIKLDLQDIVNLVSRLELNELDDFITRLKDLRAKKTDNTKLSRVQYLKGAVQVNLSPEEDNRYDFLHEKLENSTISESEREEYKKLTVKAREINVGRMKNLAELSNLTGKSMRELMKELKLYSPTNA